MSYILLFIPSGGEILLIFLVVLILFGADKIPDLARMLGKGLREFRRATDDIKREFNQTTHDITDDLETEKKSIRGDIDDMKSSIDNTLAEEDPYGENDDEPAGPARKFIDDNTPTDTSSSTVDSENTDEKTPDNATN